ncbi:hypothetical protein L198_06336 [Cryptococcus wingfieldii CBS 7118]|uniref:Uncharacterized protein n=1 Tax=Cryptococcus wingfieldii CBS 7118 TaxID=1295528 RepID=A0A1E3IMA3_9TREE|nr:hypothetical protein L198_06336 [Cryptococcus wingfieldii CBS 7118]ODN89648.1 hypothetical protein L198_06336 [Cryptococcus wingfieldii CBS 7118]
MVVLSASWLLAGFCVLPLATAYPASADTSIEDHSLSSSLSSSSPESTSSGALHPGQDRPRFMSHDTPSDHYPLDSIWWQASSHHIPRTVVLDSRRLAEAKRKLEEGQAEEQIPLWRRRSPRSDDARRSPPGVEAACAEPRDWRYVSWSLSVDR